MKDRRNFIKKLTAAGVLLNMPHFEIAAKNKTEHFFEKKDSEEMIWACLLHLGINMWEKYTPELTFDKKVWNAVTQKMTDVGLNMVVIDLADAIHYESHPEIAVRNAWSVDTLRDELKRLREMGLEPVPKLNFSTGHDAWLGKYSRMVSTKPYYEVCADLIAEVSDIFEKPRFFHLGLDEEDEANQRKYDQVVIRQGDLYWGDLYFLIGEVMKKGIRPWIWQDYVRNRPEEFAKMMPKSVVQSNWENSLNFDPAKNKSVKAFQTLEKLGYDQVPGGSNFYENTDENIMKLIRFCSKNIAPERLLGFVQSPWKYTLEEHRAHLLSAVELMGEAKIWFEKR